MRSFAENINLDNPKQARQLLINTEVIEGSYEPIMPFEATAAGCCSVFTGTGFKWFINQVSQVLDGIHCSAKCMGPPGMKVDDEHSWGWPSIYKP